MKIWNNRWINTNAPQKQGGQGRIFFVKAKNKQAETYVLKELINKKRIKRFITEVEIISKLPPHKNVIQIVDSCLDQDQQTFFYVMPIADGNLADIVNSKSLMIKGIMSLFEGMLAGVEHLHLNGIVHRDIKPENVLIKSSVPLMADFGLSIAFEDEDRLTPSEEVIGSRFYMAPEFEDGRLEKITFQSDIYSLGKILYFLLSGGKIFSREKFHEKQFSLKDQYCDERYSLFNEIFEQTINKNIFYRYKNISEFRVSLRKVMEKWELHHLSTIEEKVSLSTLTKSPMVVKTMSLVPAEKIKLLEYFASRNIILNSSTLIFLLDETEGLNPFKGFDLIAKSIERFSTADRRLFVNFIGKSEPICRSILGTLTKDEFIEQLVLPIIDDLEPASIGMIVNVIFLQLRHMPKLVGALFPYYSHFSVKTKALYLIALSECELEFGALLSEQLIKNYKVFDDNEERNVFESTMLCGFRYLDEEKIESLIFPYLSGMDSTVQGCIGRAMVLAMAKKDSGIHRVDLSKISDPVLKLIIELADKANRRPDVEEDDDE